MSSTPPEAMSALCLDCQTQNVPTHSPWFDHIWLLYSLQLSSYPFRRNDLSIDEWLAIAEMKSAIQDMMLSAE